MRLQNKVVLVTAATRGIGLACVKACAAEGATVYLAARSMEKARAAAAELHNVRAVYNDATVPESFGTMVGEVVEQSGRLDVLVNNFGVSDPRRDLDVANTEPEVYLRTVMLNLRSVFLATQAAIGPMSRTGGSIINISSVAGLVPDLSQVAYGTSKAAINHLTKLIAVQEARHGIRCNAVLPGMTATDAVSTHLSADFRDQFLRHIPLGRMGLPEEIAAAVVYFASDESAYTTGQCLSVSGGFGLATPLYADMRAISRTSSPRQKG